MKNMLKGILVLVVFMVCWGTVGYVETHYTIEGTVLKNGLIEDIRGEVWEYDNPYVEGTKVKMIMDTNCTDHNIYDDIVVKVTVKGH